MAFDEDHSYQPRDPRQRRQRLRRAVFLATGVVVGVLALRFVWGLVAERRLNAQLASYRATGEPVSVDEFNTELDAVPDADNAAVLYERAFDTYVGTSESGVLLPTFMDDPKTFTTNSAIADELMEANAAALAMLREAREKPYVAWTERLGVVPASPFQGSAKRMLARVLSVASSYHVLHGNHYEAVETLWDLVRFSDAVDAHPTMISSLIAWACQDLAYSHIEQYGAKLAPAPHGARGGATPATPEQIEDLIRVLLDDQPIRSAADRSFLGDRAGNLTYMETFKTLDWFGRGPRGSCPWRRRSM